MDQELERLVVGCVQGTVRDVAGQLLVKEGSVLHGQGARTIIAVKATIVGAAVDHHGAGQDEDEEHCNQIMVSEWFECIHKRHFQFDSSSCS